VPVADRQLPLLALPEGARRGPRVEPLRRARNVPLAPGRGPARVVQGPGGGALHAMVLSHLRREGAGRGRAAPPCRRSRRLARRRPQGARGAAHLRRLEGAVVRDRGRPPPAPGVSAGRVPAPGALTSGGRAAGPAAVVPRPINAALDSEPDGRADT